MDWFTIIALVLFFAYGVLDAVIKSRLRGDIEELQSAMLGFNFQIAILKERVALLETPVKTTAPRKTTAKEAK